MIRIISIMTLALFLGTVAVQAESIMIRHDGSSTRVSGIALSSTVCEIKGRVAREIGLSENQFDLQYKQLSTSGNKTLQELGLRNGNTLYAKSVSNSRQC